MKRRVLSLCNKLYFIIVEKTTGSGVALCMYVRPYIFVTHFQTHTFRWLKDNTGLKSLFLLMVLRRVSTTESVGREPAFSDATLEFRLVK